MPLLFAPLVPLALRLGVVAAAGYAIRRVIGARTHLGRTDQRGEDALDDLDEGLARHRLPDIGAGSPTNTALRIKRIIRSGKRGIEIDAAILGRFRIRKL